MSARPTCKTHPGCIEPCHRCKPDERAALRLASQVNKEAPVTPLPSVPVQATLSDELFPATRTRDVALVKITISGTVELTQADYLAFLSGSRIGPGAVVEIRAAGYVVMPGAAWVKRTEGSGEDKQMWHEREGRVKVKLTDLAGFSPTGEEFSE